MSREDRVDVLFESCRFGRLDRRALVELSRYFDEVCLPAGTTITIEGRPAHELVVVAEGTLSVHRSDGSPAGGVGAGATIGWAAMETRGAHDATVVASTSARLLLMSHAQFRAAVGALDSTTNSVRFPGLGRTFRRSTVRLPGLAGSFRV